MFRHLSCARVTFLPKVKLSDLDVLSNPFATSATLGHWLPESVSERAVATTAAAEAKVAEDGPDAAGGRSGLACFLGALAHLVRRVGPGALLAGCVRATAKRC